MLENVNISDGMMLKLWTQPGCSVQLTMHDSVQRQNATIRASKEEMIAVFEKLIKTLKEE